MEIIVEETWQPERACKCMYICSDASSSLVEKKTYSALIKEYGCSDSSAVQLDHNLIFFKWIVWIFFLNILLRKQHLNLNRDKKNSINKSSLILVSCVLKCNKVCIL